MENKETPKPEELVGMRVELDNIGLDDNPEDDTIITYCIFEYQGPEDILNLHRSDY